MVKESDIEEFENFRTLYVLAFVRVQQEGGTFHDVNLFQMYAKAHDYLRAAGGGHNETLGWVECEMVSARQALLSAGVSADALDGLHSAEQALDACMRKWLEVEES